MAGGIYPSRPAIQDSQLEQLRSLLAELFPANSFYSRKFTDAGVTFDVTSLGDFSRRFPFTVKTELVQNQRAQPPFGTNLTYPANRYTRFHQTSGTSGVPLRWLDTPESWDWMVGNWLEIYDAAGVTTADRVYFAFSFGPFIGFWLAFEAAARLGALCLPGGGMGSGARLNAIIENGVTVLCCTPTYALRLAEVAQAESIDLRRSCVKTILVAGEPGGSIPAVRARLERAWPGARIFDHHGMTEVGPVTFECPARPGVLHVLESAYLAEVVDPAGDAAVPAGETGELVLTTLGRLGSPLLRYRTGDLVKTEARFATGDPLPCVCGRHDLTLEGGILGRTDDMVVVRGVNVYPGAIDEIVCSIPGVSEYQVCVSVVNALVELSVRIEFHPGFDSPAAAAGLEKTFHKQLALRVPVAAVPPGTLPRSEMKARRWVRQ